MNSEEQCEIVEDLLLAYNEKILNMGTNEFVENHLKNCKNCKAKLEIIKNSIDKEKKIEKEEENIELKHLLKVNKLIKKLKISLLAIITFILLLSVIICVKGQYNQNIIRSSYNRVQELKNLDNYKLSRTVTYINHKTGEYRKTYIDLYYKDGKYKEVLPDVTFFYQDNKADIIYVFENSKKIETNSKQILETKGDYFNVFTEIVKVYNYQTNIFQRAFIEIKNDNFYGINCYVIREKVKDNEYTEIWIDKDKFDVLMVKEKYDSYYRETIYNLSINETLEEDVILDIDQYNDYVIDI